MESQKQKIESANQDLAATLIKFQRGTAGYAATTKALQRIEREMMKAHKLMEDQLNKSIENEKVPVGLLLEIHDCAMVVGFSQGAQSALMAVQRSTPNFRLR